MVDGDLSKTLASLKVVVIDLRSLGIDALNLQEKLPGSFSDDGSYINDSKSVQLDSPDYVRWTHCDHRFRRQSALHYGGLGRQSQ